MKAAAHHLVWLICPESSESDIIDKSCQVTGIIPEAEEVEMRRILIVIDMQKDFIDGALGTKEAEAIVPAVVRKIKSYPADDVYATRDTSYPADDVYATRDTHPENYLDTQEGEHLPVRHCIKGTEGWQLCKEVAPLIPEGSASFPMHCF